MLPTQEMKYLLWVLYETLRLHSVVPTVTRGVSVADTVGGVNVPAGAK